MLAHHRRGEFQTDRGKRHAAGLGVFLLATQVCREGVAHAESQALIARIALPGSGSDTRAPDQIEFAIGRQGAAALHPLQTRIGVRG